MTRSEASLEDLAGVIPILVTPFRHDGSVDLDAMDDQIEFLAGAGVRWAGFGFGSEVTRLGAAQLDAVLSRAVTAAAGRLGIFGNAEMTNVAGGIEQVDRAAAAGAGLALLRPGALEGASQEAIFDAVAGVAEGAQVPVVVQDAPQNTGTELAPSTLARLLLEVPGVAALKIETRDAAAKIGLVAGRLDGRAGALIGGAGGTGYLHELERGATGTMPGPAFPEVFAALGRLHDAGRRGRAFELLGRVMPLMALGNRDMDTFLFVQKHVLVRRGVLAGAALGRPHRDLDPRLGQEVDEVLEALALLELFDECRDTGMARRDVTGGSS